MSGLTSRQQWAHDHIMRCTCGSWVMVRDHVLWNWVENEVRPPCTHISARAMESAA